MSRKYGEARNKTLRDFRASVAYIKWKNHFYIKTKKSSTAALAAAGQ